MGPDVHGFSCQVILSHGWRLLLLLSLLLALALISSCGGGSSSGTNSTSPPDFSVTVSPSSAVVPPGGALLAEVSLNSQSGFTGSVSVSISGLPSGATVAPSSPFTMSGASQNLIIIVPLSSAEGTFSVALQASSGTLQHAASLSLQVQTQAFSAFSLYLNDRELSFAKGASAGTGVGLSLTSGGNNNYEVQFSVSGLPSGVQAAFGSNPFVASQPVTTLNFSALSTASTANYAPVTITATRTSDGAQASRQLQLNVTPPVGTLPAIRTDFIRTDGTPAAAVYDAAHSVVYASNPSFNRVDVVSPVTHQIVKSIPAPNPTGMDLSLDGKHLLVASNVQQIVSIDTSSLQVTDRTSVTPIVQGGATYLIPDLLASTSNGTVLVGMTLNSLPPAYYLEQWDPSTNKFTALSAPGITAYINQLVRTGDGQKALVVDYGTSVNMAVYDAATNTFSVSGKSPVGEMFGVAASPTSHQFAIVAAGGLVFLDDSLNLLATPAIGGTFWGMTYSPDGSKLYIAVTLSTSASIYPVILTYDTVAFSLVGIAPAFLGSDGSQASPLTADNTGLLYSSYSHGLALDDAINYQNVLTLPVGPPGPEINWGDEAALNTALVTNLDPVVYDVLPDVWFGNVRGTNIHFNNPQVSVTAPPSSSVGLVNMKAVMPDGWFTFVPQAFSYGSKILFIGGSAASSEGGASLALFGYGLRGHDNSPSVTIGGHAATVTGVATYRFFNFSTATAAYPFPIDEVMVTVPPGPPGPADITIKTSVGTATIPKGFTYLSVSDYSSADTFTYLLYDPKRHWVYLSAGDHIDVFSADTNQFLAPIVPPSLSGARQIRGLALTPDNAKLLVANFADVSLAIINPDNPASSSLVKVPVSIVNAPGVADVAATSTGKAFIDGVSGTFSGCANGQLFEVDLTTLAVKLRTDVSVMQVQGNAMSRSTTGDDVLVAGITCGTYLWSSSTGKFGPGVGLYSESSTASGDGYWFASDYIRLDPNMTQRIQTQLPEFYTSLLYSLDYAGEKLNASGSLLYSPVLKGTGIVESNGIQITDTNLGSSLGQILLSEQISSVQIPMDFDEPGNRLFLITNRGLTIVNLANPPLSIGYLSPAAGSASGGTTIKIRGSGFQPGAAVTIGGVTVPGTFVDSSTLQVSTPSGSTGGARVSVRNPDGTSYFIDAGFRYQ
jgi:hypothetical protein